MKSIWVVVLLLFCCDGAAAEERISYFRSVTIEPGVRSESVVCVACSVVVKGDLDAEIVTVGGDVTIYGRVRSDVAAVGGRVRLENGAEMDADVVAIGGMVSTAGSVKTSGPGHVKSLPWMHFPGQLSVGWRGALALLGFYVACALLPTLTLRPRRIQNVVVASRRWILTGVMGLVAIVVLSSLLNLLDEHSHSSDIVDLVVVALFLAILAVGIAGIAFAIGDLFFPGRVVEAFATGIGLLVALQLIPYFGFLVMILAACWATGAALWSGLGFRGPQPPPLKPPRSTALKLTA